MAWQPVLAIGLMLVAGSGASGSTPSEADEPDEVPRAVAVRRPGTTVQLPTFGIAIDAAGVLSVKSFPDPGGRLLATRRAAARQQQPAKLFAGSPLRKISLVRLERAIQQRLQAGQPLEPEMQHLAGLQRLRYVFLYPQQGDIVIAGPAEGFAPDPAGRMLGVTSGRPPLLLDDLVVALRAYPPGQRVRPFIGCTIDPDPAGLNRLTEFQRTIPRRIPQRQRTQVAQQIAQGTRESLGMANIRVFGISPETHFSQVLIEADYRMKLIAVGLEPPPVRMTTFAEALSGGSQAILQRWWFTPNYKCLRVTRDQRAMQLVGQGVLLHGEEKQIDGVGGLVDSGRAPSKASQLFTTAFTKKYEEIADAQPVYAELRNLIDLLVAAAMMNHHDYYGQAGWTMPVFGDPQVFRVEPVEAPKQVESVVNVFWKANRLLAPAGGGVSIQADLALDPKQQEVDPRGVLGERKAAASCPPGQAHWWWD